MAATTPASRYDVAFGLGSILRSTAANGPSRLSRPIDFDAIHGASSAAGAAKSAASTRENRSNWASEPPRARRSPLSTLR